MVETCTEQCTVFTAASVCIQSPMRDVIIRRAELIWIQTAYRMSIEYEREYCIREISVLNGGTRRGICTVWFVTPHPIESCRVQSSIAMSGQARHKSVVLIDKRLEEGGGYQPPCIFSTPFFPCGFFGNASVYLSAIYFYTSGAKISNNVAPSSISIPKREVQ